MSELPKITCKTELGIQSQAQILGMMADLPPTFRERFAADVEMFREKLKTETLTAPFAFAFIGLEAQED